MKSTEQEHTECHAAFEKDFCPYKGSPDPWVVWQAAWQAARRAPVVPQDPMDWPLPCDVTVGHGTVGKGVKLRTLVLRMKALYKVATGNDADEVAARTPEQRATLLAAFQSQIAAAPKPPEAEGLMSEKRTTKPDAAPVQLPEPLALCDGTRWFANDESAICACADLTKLVKVYSEQQVRQLLAAHNIAP